MRLARMEKQSVRLMHIFLDTLSAPTILKDDWLSVSCAFNYSDIGSGFLNVMLICFPSREIFKNISAPTVIFDHI